MKHITSWSPSRLSTYNDCPRKAKYKFVDKLPEPSGPAASRGTAIHEGLEQYVRGETAVLPAAIKPGFKKIRALLDRLRAGFAKGRVLVEQELAFDADWLPSGYKGDEDTVSRFKLDILEDEPKNTAHVIDWKSGKLKPGGAYDDQVNAYSVAALSHYDIDRVRTSLVFVDHDEILERPSGKLSQEDLPQQQRKWDLAVGPMFRDTTFRPHPSHLCGWCHFSKARNGPCEY